MLGYLILGAGVYYLYKNPKKEGLGVGENPVSGQNAQPSQISPVRMPQDPRVDNQNQPWYAGSQTAISDVSGGKSNLGASAGDIWSRMDISDSAHAPIQNNQLIHPGIQEAFSEGTQIFGGKY